MSADATRQPTSMVSTSSAAADAADTHSLRRKDWDSEFFDREIFALHVSGTLSPRELGADLEDMDEQGVWGTECHLFSRQFDAAAVLEELGFRLVDSRAVFVSRWSIDDVRETEVPHGSLRPVRDADLGAVDNLTVRNLVDNPSFRSRFADRRLFTREESIRYYAAWNAKAFEEAPDLFAVWETAETIVGFFSYLPSGDHEGLPLFKGVLTAVDRRHRGHDVQNAMQAYLFKRFGVDAWALDNTTQIGNIPVLRNHVRAGKELSDTALTFYRVNDSSNPLDRWCHSDR